MFNNIITKSISLHKSAIDLINFDEINEAANLMISTLKNLNSIFWCGNGGSAAQANHLSAELVGGMFENKVKPFKSISLNVDSSFITAWSNDDSFENIFARQLEALGNTGDIIICISTSGNSKNILEVAKFAQKNKIKVISLTGNNGGNLKELSDINININSSNTARIQEMHITIGHILCEIVEQSSIGNN